MVGHERPGAAGRLPRCPARRSLWSGLSGAVHVETGKGRRKQQGHSDGERDFSSQGMRDWRESTSDVTSPARVLRGETPFAHRNAFRHADTPPSYSVTRPLTQRSPALARAFGEDSGIIEEKIFSSEEPINCNVFPRKPGTNPLADVSGGVAGIKTRDGGQG